MKNNERLCVFLQTPGKIKFSFTQQRKRTGSMKLSPHGSQLVSSIPGTADRLSTPSLGVPTSPYSSLGDVNAAKIDQPVRGQMIPGISSRPPLPGKR